MYFRKQVYFLLLFLSLQELYADDTETCEFPWSINSSLTDFHKINLNLQSKNPKNCLAPLKDENKILTLKSDLSICKCFKETRHPDFSVTPLANVNTTQELKYSKEELETKAEETAAQYVQEQNALAFQANLMSKGNLKLTEKFLADLPDLKSKEGGLSTLFKKRVTPINAKDCVDKVCKTSEARGRVLTEKEKKSLSDAMTEVVGEFKLDPEKNPEIFNDQIDIQNGQCVSAKDYFMWRQLPRGEELLGLIQKTSLNQFSSADWDYEILEKKYEGLMNLPLNERKLKKKNIVEIKEKLRFLNSNQMLKTFLAADPDLSDLGDDSLISEDRKKSMKKTWEEIGSNIDEKKKELFNIIKKVAASQEVNKFKLNDSATLETYQNEFNNFFKGTNLDLLINENERQGHQRVNSNFQRRILPPPLTRRAIVDNFLKYSDIGDPDDCLGKNVDETKCSNIYARYCKQIVSLEM
jgi:hypothetical protein